MNADSEFVILEDALMPLVELSGWTHKWKEIQL